MVQYSTALSHIFLAGTSFYCLRISSINQLLFCKFSFGIIMFHSILGIWRWGNPQYGYKIDKIYKLAGLLQDLLVLPCIVTTIWLRYNFSFSLAGVHTVISIIPLLIYLFNRRNEPVDAFLIGNVLSLVVISTYHGNPFGISMAMSYIISYFIIKHDMLSNLPIEVPTQDLFNYSMCFFVIFALRAVLETGYFI
ncbi:hypothetical protein ABEB36_009666 [Hypothenemus hampei]|uniref:Uncharacterized protein n=1 Tax=Hypothenemus hampei TaxID=57062 RepID=A0ABD1EK11_HYPHA